MPLPQHDPLVHKCPFCSLVIGCAREYSKATYVLTTFSSTPMSFDTTSAFIALHPQPNGYFLFLEGHELE